jgi:3-hydroxyacyl-[acyl-carrier-protein] dehydratase
MIRQTDDIYKIISFEPGSETIKATITFHDKHPIFAGHFPGNPIVPGVIQVRIIKDLLEIGLGQELLMVQAKNIKFTNIISPLKNPGAEIRINIQKNEDQTYTVQANLFSGETTFMKFSGTFKTVIKLHN